MLYISSSFILMTFEYGAKGAYCFSSSIYF